MTLLVTGFGPFLGVTDNPSGALALAMNGAEVGGHQVVGRVLPASYERGPAEAIAWARQVDARLVIGLGVASGSAGVRVETRAVRRCHPDKPDVDGVCGMHLGHGEDVHATLDTARLAQALGADLSDDAGTYVCNAWLCRVTEALTVPVGFVHLPVDGLQPSRFLQALASML